jgi:hypothetical protein
MSGRSPTTGVPAHTPRNSTPTRCARRRLRTTTLTSSTRLALVPSYLATTLTLNMYKYCNHWSIEGVQLIFMESLLSSKVLVWPLVGMAAKAITNRHSPQVTSRTSPRVHQFLRWRTKSPGEYSHDVCLPSLRSLDLNATLLNGRTCQILAALSTRWGGPHYKVPLGGSRWIPIDSESPKLEGRHLDSWSRDGRSPCNHGAGSGSEGAQRV